MEGLVETEAPKRKRYMCGQCRRKFHTAEDLAAHMETHDKREVWERTVRVVTKEGPYETGDNENKGVCIVAKYANGFVEDENEGMEQEDELSQMEGEPVGEQEEAIEEMEHDEACENAAASLAQSLCKKCVTKRFKRLAIELYDADVELL